MSKLYLEFKKLGIIKKGNFKLKSGRTSIYYIDIKKAFGDPGVFNLISEELSRKIDEKVTCIVGSGHGGLPLATAVSLRLRLPLVLVRDNVKKHGIQKTIDGYVPTKKDRVAIIDDVFTTGTCISNIIEVLNKTNAKIMAGYVVVNRGDFLKFKIPIKSLMTMDQLTK